MTKQDAEMISRLVTDTVRAALLPVRADFKALIDRLDRAESEVKESGQWRERVAVLESKQAIPGPPGEKGNKGDPAVVDMAEIDRLVEVHAKRLVAEIPKPKDGKDATVDPAVIEAQVKRAIAEIPKPKDGLNGKDATPIDPAELKPLVSAEVARVVAELPRPKDGLNGKDAEPIDLVVLERSITAEVKRVVAEIPKPQNGKDGKDGKDGAIGNPGMDGKSVDMAVVNAEIDRVVDARVKAAVSGIPAPKDGRDGVDGKDAVIDWTRVSSEIESHAKQFVAAIPTPKDGRSVTPEELAPMVSSEVKKAISELPPAPEAVGIAGALIDRHGHLVVTLTNGETKDVGEIVGRDGINGKDGAPGRDVDMDAVVQQIKSAVDAIPRPKDGLNGKDGADGLGFDDLDSVFDEQQGFRVRFVRGSEAKEFPLHSPFDAGVWRPGVTYPKGAGVTVKGAFFIARESTQTRPDDGTVESARAWRLAVKGGRDGKPGRDGKDSGGNA